jgi:hypothetical protein
MSGKHEAGTARGMVRQGDVLLVPVDGIPWERRREVSATPRGLVLAEGETTGHAHVVRGHARLIRATPHYLHRGATYLVVTGRAALVHEEHDPIALARGTYELRRQREYERWDRRRGFRFRQVVD